MDPSHAGSEPMRHVVKESKVAFASSMLCGLTEAQYTGAICVCNCAVYLAKAR